MQQASPSNTVRREISYNGTEVRSQKRKRQARSGAGVAAGAEQAQRGSVANEQGLSLLGNGRQSRSPSARRESYMRDTSASLSGRSAVLCLECKSSCRTSMSFTLMMKFRGERFVNEEDIGRLYKYNEIPLSMLTKSFPLQETL